MSRAGFVGMSAVAMLTAVAVLTTASQAAAQVPVGDFYFFDRSDSGTRRASITTLAEESHVTGAGGLTWFCEDGERRLIVSSTYLGQSMRARVRWAFDGEEPGEPESWILRRTGMAVIAPAEVETAFTRRALESSGVVLQLSDYEYRRHTYTFKLDGLTEGLEMLRCGPGVGSN
jgi:hypothetical protein